MDDSEQGNLRYENGVLKGELNQLRERLADIDTQHDRERRVLSDQIEDLRKRLDQAEQERREKDRQLTALLSVALSRKTICRLTAGAEAISSRTFCR